MNVSKLWIILVLFQVGVSQAEYEYLKPQDTTSSKIEQCPPVEVSSPEEIAHYCHRVRGQRFEMNKEEYKCMGGQNSRCEGRINPQKELPTCSQPVIPSCEDETIYKNFNEHSNGPCMFRENDIAWHSARCGGGRFSCWDTTLMEWCQGTVDDSSLPGNNTIVCPPTNVYSRHEATHYCSKSGLTTRIGPKDPKTYKCLQKDGSEVCTGTIDTKRQPPPCSIPIHSCGAMHKVCEIGRKTYCDEELSIFECWDIDIDRWCLGRIVKPYKQAHDKHMTNTLDSQGSLGTDTNSRSNPADQEEEGQRGRGNVWSQVGRGGFMMAAIMTVGGISLRSFRLSKMKVETWRNTMHSPTELGYYQPVSDGMELTVLVA